MVPSGQPVPGWHGKLPTLGDFASRRVDPVFLELWDGHLASAMLMLRERLGDDWLPTFLASPSWQFLLMPGVLGGAAAGQAWAGVLMPSVDRVGRYFPFTIVQALDKGAVTASRMPPLWQWLARVDGLAADAMHDDWSVDRLEDELRRMAAMSPSTAAPSPVPMPPPMGRWVSAGLDADAGPAGWIATDADAVWGRHAAGTAYWHAGATDGTPRLLLSRGVPLAPMICGLLGGPMP